jgi:hypothetical protein
MIVREILVLVTCGLLPQDLPTYGSAGGRLIIPPCKRLAPLLFLHFSCCRKILPRSH